MDEEVEASAVTDKYSKEAIGDREDITNPTDKDNDKIEKPV